MEIVTASVDVKVVASSATVGMNGAECFFFILRLLAGFLFSRPSTHRRLNRLPAIPLRKMTLP